jgi:5-methyltetrahydropteroyltriglutamate--homocysteine methyltransferase
MVPGMSPPFRAEHVGSLLRPPALTAAFRAFAEKRIDAAAFAAAQDAAIREAVAEQQALGFRVVTDGEFRRGSYWGHFIGPVAGLAVKPARFRFHDEAGGEQDFLAPHVEGRLRRTRPISLAEFAYLKSVARATPKLTLPAPPTFQFWRGRAGVEGYDGLEALYRDLGEVYRQEIAELHAAGCRYLQLDEVPLVMLCDPAVQEAVRADGDDPARLTDLYLTAINAALAACPPDMTVALHLCRGNFKGKHLSAGGYEPVAERLFNGLFRVDAFFLEYDTARAGDFAPLRFLPKTARAVLGLVSSKTPALESLDALRRRLDEATRIVPLERLGLSPQCGFASAVSGNPLTPADQRAKLALVVETARAVWGGA